MAYQLFNGQLDDEEGPGYALFTGELDTGKRELPEGVRPSEAGGGRGFVNPPVIDNRSLIQRVGDFLKPESKSVLETTAFTPQEKQSEIDRRLSYGAGPISQGTAAKADLLRSGILTTEDKTVRKTAAGMAEKKAPSFADLIERANNPVNVRAARDAKADEFRTFGEWTIDQLAGPLAQGAVSLVQLPTNIVAPGSSLAQTLRETQKELQAQESDVMKAQRDQMRERVQSEEGFFGKYLSTIESLVTNPALGLSEAAKQVPNFLGIMGLAKVGTAIAGGGVGVATRVSPAVALSEAISGGALQVGARAAGATAGGLTAATVMTAGDAAGNVYEKLIDPKQTPPSVWQENPDYQKLIAEGKTPAEAIDEIATAKARLAAIITAPLGVLGFMGAEAAIVARGAGKALTSVATPRGAAKLFGKELIGEQFEEGGTQLGANIIAQTVNKEQKLLEGVPEAMATAAVTSAPFSAVAVGQQVRDALNRPAAPFDIVGDTLARRALDVQSYDDNIISPTQTAKIAQAQQDLGQASSAADAVAAAENLAGSVDELLVPGTAITPLPRIEPTLTGDLLPVPGRIEPTLTGDLLAPIPRRAEPIPGVDLPPVNAQVEQQFGLDKLRLNAPRPQRIQGEPVANLTDDQLTTIAGDETVPAITRRSAAIEITARQAEQTAQPAPIAGAPLATPDQAAQPVVGAPIESRTYTAEGLGKLRLGDRRTLSQQFDQVENQDGSVTFTPKPAAQAAAPGAAPVAGGFISIPETQAVSDAAAPTVAGLPDANRARAAAQTTLDRWASSNGVEAPQLNAPAPAQEAAVNEIASALSSQFGGRLVAFTDPSPTSINGVAIGGTAFVNTSGDVNVLRTGLHEFKHTVEQIAAAETSAGLTDTPAQKFTASIDSVFDDITDEGKRAYIENFLHRDELVGIADPVAREQRVQQLLTSDNLKSEMTADFLGNRATDKAFWADVAKADPQGFKGFVSKWVGIIDNLLQTLRGSKNQGQKESAKVDQYIRDLNRAKMVARDALVAYNKGALGAVNGQRIDGIARSQIQPGVAGAIGQLSEEGGGGPAPNYGTARQGAVSVIGRHYSTAPRQSLNGAYYGRGLKGAERNRLDSSPDPRLKNRIYFYVDKGAGIRPESGVGGVAHEVRLNNVYDPETRLIKTQANANAFESAVINAGFDGYIAPFGNDQAAVVLLGMKHKAVPVRMLGQVPSAAAPEAAAPTKLTKGLLSREANAIDVAKIPGAQVRMGNLEIPADQTEAANTELERIGSDVRFAKKQQAPFVGPPVPKDFGVYQDVAKSLKMSDAEYNASALPMMTGLTKDQTFQAPRIGGVPEVVQWLDARRAESGLPILDIKKPEDREVLAKLLSAEAVAAIRSAGNAVEWYDETVAKTLRIMAVKYPELNTDPAARNAFLMAVAISSQTMNVEDNLRYASKQYEAYRASVNAQGVGKFPEVGTGKSAPAMGNNFALANDVLAEMGPDLLRRFLQTEFTKRDLETMGFPIGGESMDEKMLGSAIFGPKIGFGFYSNLTGNFEPVTMDMWFMRTVGRLAGTLPAFDPVLFPKQVAKLRAALAETGPASVGLYADQFDKATVDEAMKTDAGAVALARQVNSLHNRQFIKERAAFDSGARKKTALVGAAGAIIKSAEKPKDAPKSGGERQLLRDVVRQMVDKVEAETGKRVPPAALQALIWYPEQELYKKLGVKLRVTSQDYAGAAKSLLTKEGFDGKRISAAAKSGPGPTRQVAGKSVAGANKQAGQPSSPSGPLGGADRQTFIEQRTYRVRADEVVGQSLEDIFQALDKRGLAKTKAEVAYTARPDGPQIKYIQDNWLDILSELDDSGLVKINCK